MSGLVLAGEFPAATEADWLKRVDAVLKGARFDDRVVSATEDGFRLKPLYGQISGARAQKAHYGPWTVLQRVDHPDAAKANAQALDDLENGTTGLALVIKGSASARGFGLDAATLGRVLEGVALHAIALRIEGDGADQLAEHVARQPVDPERINISFGGTTAAIVPRLKRQGFRGPFLEADGRPWHELGATAAEELGVTLAGAVNFMHQLDFLDDADLAQAVSVTLAANQDMFGTIAKVRAMRLLWRRVLDASGLPDAPLRLHGETSFRMMAARDPHSNILRATAACFGAGLGGADSFTVLPFSLAQGLPNAFSRRVARNVQTVLMDEANLWRVADPASGAGYIESLTSSLCEKAWCVFQAAERGVWPSPDGAAAHSLPVIGTTAYQLAEERPGDVEAVE